MERPYLPQNYKVIVSGAPDKIQALVGSVTGGVGNLAQGVSNQVDNVFSGRLPLAPSHTTPTVADYGSDEALQRFKDYSLNINQSTNKLNFWEQQLDRVSGALLLGCFVGIGAIGTWTAIGGLLAGALAVGATALVVKQMISRTQTGKGMDIKDFEIKREAALIAQELKKALGNDPALDIQIVKKDDPLPEQPARKDGKEWAQLVIEPKDAEKSASSPTFH